MTKSEFKDYLLWLQSTGVSKLFVYQCGYMDGSIEHQVEVCERPTRDFKYLVFEGTLSDVFKHRSVTFTDHWEPFHEPVKEETRTLQELVCMSF